MRLRVAKKMLYWGHPFYTRSQLQRASARVRRYRANGTHGRIIKASTSLARYIDRNGGDANPDGAVGVRRMWEDLRSSIIAGWNPQYWSIDDYNDAMLRVCVFSTTPSDLADDLTYYSDRWCSWRVAAIDKTMQSLYGL